MDGRAWGWENTWITGQLLNNWHKSFLTTEHIPGQRLNFKVHTSSPGLSFCISDKLPGMLSFERRDPRRPWSNWRLRLPVKCGEQPFAALLSGQLCPCATLGAGMWRAFLSHLPYSGAFSFLSSASNLPGLRWPMGIQRVPRGFRGFAWPLLNDINILTWAISCLQSNRNTGRGSSGLISGDLSHVTEDDGCLLSNFLFKRRGRIPNSHMISTQALRARAIFS